MGCVNPVALNSIHLFFPLVNESRRTISLYCRDKDTSRLFSLLQSIVAWASGIRNQSDLVKKNVPSSSDLPLLPEKNL